MPHAGFALMNVTYTLLSFAYMIAAVAIWRTFDKHATDFDCARADCSAGRSRPMSRAMMPITTRSSTNVNARQCVRWREVMKFSFSVAHGVQASARVQGAAWCTNNSVTGLAKRAVGRG